MTSIKGQLNKQETIKWIQNSLTYLAPALLVFLTALSNGVPINQAFYSVYLWGINVLIDFLKKFNQGQ